MKLNQRAKMARFAKLQQAGKFDEIIAMIGTDAEPYNKIGQELVLKELLKLNPHHKAVLIGKQELANLPYIQFAPDGNECKAISFYKLGEVTQRELDLLAVAIAYNAPNIEVIRFFDNAGQPLNDENGEQISGYFADFVQRIRSGDVSPVMLQYLEAPQQQADKTAPYFDEREVNGVKGLFYIKPQIDKETGEILSERERWTCSPLTLKGEGYNESGEAYYIFEWMHPQRNKPHTEAIPLSSFGKSAGWEIMQKYGLKMTNESYLNKLADHFHFNGNHETKWTVTEITGWKNEAYLLPSGEVIGQATPPVLFKNQNDGENPYQTKGTLEGWQNAIGANVRNNAFMMLSVGCSLASPLLKLVNAKSFGVHLYNDSSKGKTTALNIANSVWGNPEGLDQKWNQTPVAMMNNAQSRNDNFLTLDEIGQCKNFDDLEQTAYLLFNETGRTRGKKDGGNQQISKWKITALSTGEIDLEGFLQSKGRNIQAGSLVRLLNIPMEEPSHLHQFRTAKEHADHLNEAVGEYYGVVGREWLKFIINHKEEVKTAFKHYRALWLERLPKEADSQVQRVVNNFAILETALQLAGFLTGWTESENREAVIKCFNSWIAIFGTRSKEETNIIEQFNGWLQQAQHTDFIEVYADYKQGAKPTGRTVAGYKMLVSADNPKEHFLIYPTVFKEATKGRAKEVILRALRNAKMLDTTLEKNRNYPYQKKISAKLEKNRPACYVVFHLETDDEEDKEKE